MYSGMSKICVFMYTHANYMPLHVYIHEDIYIHKYMSVCMHVIYVCV